MQSSNNLHLTEDLKIIHELNILPSFCPLLGNINLQGACSYIYTFFFTPYIHMVICDFILMLRSLLDSGGGDVRTLRAVGVVKVEAEFHQNHVGSSEFLFKAALVLWKALSWTVP